ncbi:Hsp20/alpha crystallin family protein [Jidongwangia harbinensis]|uniref:Hsp20/alpha crystallin family protein n=1 Tax=Jidongwangia harbinensis TaxID=2878561 RepID=UPI001CD971A4|nr:Hsp20/alpha crystallin family protein [Jidongwangia harbinensis]MCA2218997.1 Hsp20/alpha crystallin family protein [Jidongwangia harbinensis]
MSTLTRFRGTMLNPFDFGLSWLPMVGPVIRLEEAVEEDRYVLRAEIPGVDPAKDVHLTLAEGELRLQVERKEEHAEKGRSEFHYGTFYRTMPLPAGVRADTLSATYTDGILEITALVGETESGAKPITITVGKGKAK